MSTNALSQEIALLAEKLRENLTSYRKLVGTNMAALRYSSKFMEDNKNDKTLFREAILSDEKAKTESKKRQASLKNNKNSKKSKSK